MRVEDLKIHAYLARGSQVGHDLKHGVVVVPLGSGEYYVLDVAGAEVGNHRAVVPVDEYTDMVTCTGPLQFDQFGSKAQRRDQMQASTGALVAGEGTVMDSRVHSISKEVVQALEANVKGWEEANNMTIATMLNEKEAVFETLESSLLATVKDAMPTNLKAWKVGGQPGSGMPGEAQLAASEGGCTEANQQEVQEMMNLYALADRAEANDYDEDVFNLAAKEAGSGVRIMRFCGRRFTDRGQHGSGS